MMSSRHLGQYKGNFYIMDEVLLANLPPTKAPVTKMRFQIVQFPLLSMCFQIDPLWFAYSNACIFIIVFIVSVRTGGENVTIS